MRFIKVRDKNDYPEVFTRHSLLSLCICTPSLDGLIRIIEFFQDAFAFGVDFGSLIFAAHVAQEAGVILQRLDHLWMRFAKGFTKRANSSS